jgi:hypothetical protein
MTFFVVFGPLVGLDAERRREVEWNRVDILMGALIGVDV